MSGDDSRPQDLHAPVVELLGLVAFGEMLAFERMARDAALAPDLRRRAMLGELAAVEVDGYRRVAARLAELGVDPQDAMAPYVGPVEEYHDATEPKDWLEALTKVYVGDRIADDFLAEVAALLDAPDGDLVRRVLHDSRYASFAEAELRDAIAEDPKVANRLSMWARRLVGETLSHAQRVAAERAPLTALVVADNGVQKLFQRLTTAHAARMNALDLNN
ncbi:ferritin-like fold-containing protein [Catenuloplanes japonicus]|uniref:ferritin-like fold-containing protein n=1 Tax=Catenuloplanes japonicus TaxID=33876 RepID=UPI00068BAB4B|nr:ferritin-like fold-containing protein [Catenuloplanes japonicus]